MTYRVLRYRREHEELFARGGYVPLESHGEQRHHVAAFARVSDAEAVLIVVPRLVARLLTGRPGAPIGVDVWGATMLALPRGQENSVYRNLLTGERLAVAPGRETPGLPLAQVLGHFPVAILERTSY